MDDATRRQLGEINRRFYAMRAGDFSASRDHPWPGWERLIPLLPEPARGGALHVLDVGCGNGRFASFLHTRGIAPLRYVGLDSCRSLLDHAHTKLAKLAREGMDLAQMDVLAGEPGSALPDGRFELVAAFGLLHHVPGRAARHALVHAMAQRVSPGGLLTCTFWRFGDAQRFAGRRVEWRDYNRQASQPVDLRQLDAGDQLLGFGETDGPLRFCHHCDDEEIDSILAISGLEVLARFDADGRSGDLNHYAVLQRVD